MKRSVWPSYEGDFQNQCASLSEQQTGVSWSLQISLHYTTFSSFTYSTSGLSVAFLLVHSLKTLAFNDFLSLHACRLAHYRRAEFVRLRIPTTPWSSNSTLNVPRHSCPSLEAFFERTTSLSIRRLSYCSLARRPSNIEGNRLSSILGVKELNTSRKQLHS